MDTVVNEVADGIYRLSTYVESANLVFNQYLVTAEQPLLFHCGMRQLFPLISSAAAKIIPLDRLRWVSFGHFEADECGSLNQWLAMAPEAVVVFGQIGCMVSVNDFSDRPPKAISDGDSISLGDRELLYIATPHVPHGWDAGLLFDKKTSTLLCGDLFTALGRHDPTSRADLVGRALQAEDMFGATALTPSTKPTIKRLAALNPQALATMHGPCFEGDCVAALHELAEAYGERMVNT